MTSVLVIMNNFAPQNNCGSIPNTKLIKYLARQDVDITLITSAITPDMNLDEKLLPRELERIRVLRVPYGAFFSKTIQASRNRITVSGVKDQMKAETRPVRAAVVSVLKDLYFDLRNLDWTVQALKLVRRELHGSHFDCVYSSYPERMSHILAQRVREAGMADRWIADFRDPMIYDFYYTHGQRRDLRRQQRIERQADLVTIVSEDSRDKFRCPGVPDSKLICIPNGYDPEDFTDDLSSHGVSDGVLRFFYAGTLYAGKRDFTVLFRALSELICEGIIDPSRVRVDYAGNEWSVMESFADRYALANICTNHGFIPRSRVLELMAQSDCSLVSSHNTAADRGVVTGKVFEQLLIGKPIIAIISGDIPDSELGCIVRDCRAGIVYEQPRHETDYPALKQWLREAYTQKVTTGQVVSTLDPQCREQYSYAQLSRRLFALMGGATYEETL